MKKAITLILIVLILSTCAVSALYAATASFKITFTIPAIIGLNVPPYENAYISNATTNNDLADITTEEIWRDNQLIVLKTIVIK